MSYLNRFGLLDETQFGLCSEKSTEGALIRVCFALHSGLNLGKFLCGLVCGNAAFDKVKYSLLIETMRQLGFGGFFLDWVTSYLQTGSE